MKFAKKIDDDIKQSMRERAKEKLEALRSVKSAFMHARTEKGAGSELSDDEELKIMQKLVNQRKDSAAIYRGQNRHELADQEIREAEFIRGYLPEQLNEEELRNYLKDIISEIGAEGMKDMGKVMGRASSELMGKADGKTISTIVRKLLE